ncbi:hypothetical protein [Lederbergia citrea]|uniref:Uncharacterized protein n=1 Tax=Lederbergia citrea TaxID=2833581 RepID=A0A942Z1V0_9BACI|nr:hypothetical protein [Lederbergia citrea]MBS4221863.1 hypothetical protein [Lederbergia citrea]
MIKKITYKITPNENPLQLKLSIHKSDKNSGVNIFNSFHKKGDGIV